MQGEADGNVTPSVPRAILRGLPGDARNRMSVFFRAFTALPIVIIMYLISGAISYPSGTHDGSVTYSTAGAGGILLVATLLMILFRQKYPRWWFDWHLALYRFTNRVSAYIILMRDEYPSTDEEQAVHLDIAYPYENGVLTLNRWLPIVKWLLAFPHYFVLIGLGIAAFVVVVICWFAILFTGTMPRGLFDFLVGVQRWSNRVTAYAILLVTDQYPPFRLDP
jgi:hypothetical protein